MKKLIALIVVIVLATSLTFAADVTNTFNQVVTCPATQLLTDGTHSADLTGIVAGAAATTQDVSLSWGFQNWGNNGHFQASIVHNYAGLTVTDQYSSTDLGSTTVVEGATTYTFSQTGNPCNATGSINVKVLTTYAPPEMAADTYHITYVLTFTDN